MRQLVSVTQDDIDKGCVGVANNCPIALALLRLPGVGYASVYGHAATYPGVAHRALEHGDGYDYPTGNPTWWKVSRAAQRFINAFDHGRPVKPFNFYMEKFGTDG